MILKASQRGSAKQLALHLLNSKDNEHVDVHELRGFVSDDLTAALKEAQATASGTRCRQYLFSVSLNPPADETVSTDQFENAIQHIEDRNGLQGQPRAIVFHEKEGRRHAHVVWSRIDAETMTARNLPHFKRKLQDVSRQLYIENDWKMPKGLMKQGARDPRNFTLAEWQQAKRIGLHAGDLKEMAQHCWAASDSKSVFAQALSERGFVLARGDRRDFVVISCEGEVFGLRGLTGKRVIDLRAKLGDAADLPGVTEATQHIATDMKTVFQRHMRSAKDFASPRMSKLDAQRQVMAEAHRTERLRQKVGQNTRWSAEAKARAARFKSGLAGIWQFVTGGRQRIIAENESEALEALRRDRAARDALITEQLRERQALQTAIMAERRRYVELIRKLRGDRSRLDQALAERAKLETQSQAEVRAERYAETKDKLSKLRRKTRKPRPKRRSSSRKRTPPSHDL